MNPTISQIKRLFALTISLVIWANFLHGDDVRVLQGEGFKVIFGPSLDSAAREVADIYPEIKRRVEMVFGWDFDLEPSILLIKDSEYFQSMSKNPLTVAYAVPEKNLIVIDHSKMNTDPFNIEITLRHELCHLLIHYYIQRDNLPRWLDEGVCQWASDGIGNIIMDQKRSLLNKAAFRGDFIPLGALKRGFPSKKEPLLLAYEESKSFVAYIIGRFGKEGILAVLESMKAGKDADTAILKTFSVPLAKLEGEWYHSLRQQVAWFAYFSYHLYEILFALTALVAIFAFIRIVMRKRSYMREEEEGPSTRA
jgi:hypothetical protein